MESESVTSIDAGNLARRNPAAMSRIGALPTTYRNASTSRRSLTDIVQAVADANGLITMRMSQLRDAYGAGRLGVHVCAGISSALAERGVGHYPEKLPGDQFANVRLYRLGSPAAELIESVLTLGPEEDDKLRQFAANDTVDMLQRVRNLVCP